MEEYIAATREENADAIAIMSKAMVENDSGPEGSVLYDIHAQEFAGGYENSAAAALEALFAAGYRLVYPGHTLLPADHHEAEVMNIISNAVLKPAEGG